MEDLILFLAKLTEIPLKVDRVRKGSREKITVALDARFVQSNHASCHGA